MKESFSSFGQNYLGDTTIAGTVMVTGQTMLGNTSISGTMSVDGRINVNGSLSISENTINVVGTPVTDGGKPTDGILYLQKSAFANLIDLFNGQAPYDYVLQIWV